MIHHHHLKDRRMTDTEIIEGCIAGDASAQRMLCKKYKTYMQAACLRYVHNKYEAEDIIQEALISIFKDIHRFKGDCSLKVWLYQVTKNKAINHYNREKRESMQHMAIEDYITVEKGRFSFEDKFLAADQLKKAMKILQDTCPKQYTNFRLYFIEGMEHKEIAEDIGISEGTSKSNTARAVARLMRILRGFDISSQYKVSA